MSRFWLKIIAAAAVAAFFIAVPLLFTGFSKKSVHKRIAVNDTGEFAVTDSGRIHYEFSGDPEGRIVLLIHGFAIPMFVWDKNADALIKSGYRVLRFDLYGRGFSDRPRRKYSPEMFERQILDLVSAAGVGASFHIAGISLGGAIAAHFSVKHPDMVDKIALIAPAGFPSGESAVSGFIRTPVLGDYFFTVAGDRGLIYRNKSNFLRPDAFPEFNKRFEEELDYLGYKRALLSTLRHFPMQNMEQAFLDLGRSGKDVLLLWGEYDYVIPPSTAEMVRKAVPQAEYFPIPDAGHISVYENPEAVNKYLIDFFQDN